MFMSCQSKYSLSDIQTDLTRLFTFSLFSFLFQQVLSCLISLFTAPTAPASLKVLSRVQRRQHMFVARLIRWRGLYSRHSGLGLCPLSSSDGGCFPPRPGCLRPGRPRLCPLRLASPPTTAISNLTNNVCNVMITLQ